MGIQVEMFSRWVAEKLPTAEVSEGFVMVCHSGSAMIDYAGVQHFIAARDIVVVMPGDNYSMGAFSTDFTASWVRFSAAAVGKVVQNIPAALIKFLAEHPTHNLTEERDYENRVGYLKLISSTLCEEQNPYSKEIVRALLRSLLLEAHNGAVKAFQRNDNGPKFRNEILNRFVTLVAANPQNREVAYFAKLLTISPKHLSAIVFSGTNMTAKEFIEKRAVEEIKRLLLATTLTAQQIAERLNFSGTGNLCRFFKTNTNTTLSDFRREAKNGD